MVEKILAAFNLELHKVYNRYTGCCPIHKGDNKTAFTIYDSGIWRCFTMGCHEKYGGNLIGLIRSLGEARLKKEVSWAEAKAILEKIIGNEVEFLSNDINSAFLLKPVQTKTTNVTRDRVRQKLEIPATYFLARNFSAEVLDRYDVGFCSNKKSRFFNRAVVPIYNNEYEYVIGYTGRDTTEKSNLKWLHDSFERGKILYNSWFAKKEIERTNTAILVESPGNIWRLEEASIKCGLALFGTEISFNQMRLLSQLGVLNLILLLDNDEAGKLATARLVKKLKGLYNIIIPTIDFNDVGDCPIPYLQEKINPILLEL